MRRAGLLVLVLAALSLTTAFAASFDVQAEDITSFSTSVSISVPTTTPPPPPVPPGHTYYLTDAAPHAHLVTVEPDSNEGNKSATLGFGPLAVTTTDSSVTQGNRIHYVTWRSAPVASGYTFTSRTVTVQFERTANLGGQITAGLFSCDPGVYFPTVVAQGCRHFASGQGGGNTITLTIANATLDPGDELRLKMVSATAEDSAIQWGWKPQNRDGKLVIQ